MTTDTQTRQPSVRDEALSRVLSREEEAIRQERQEQEARANNEAAKQKLGAEAQATTQAALAAREAGAPEFMQRLAKLCDLGEQLIDAKARYDRARAVAQKYGCDVAPWPRPLGLVRGGKPQGDGSTTPLVGREERDLLDRAKQLLSQFYGDV